MARPGRKPVPTATKRRQGNPGHRPLNPAEPQPAPLTPAAIETIPDEIRADPGAVRFWETYAPQLVALRLLTTLDVAKFAMACSEAGQYWTCMAVIQQHGALMDGRFGPIPRPELALAARHLASACKILADFGFSPSDRARLITGAAGTDDPLETLLRATERGHAA